eukprot:gene17693-biopygen11399
MTRNAARSGRAAQGWHHNARLAAVAGTAEMSGARRSWDGPRVDENPPPPRGGGGVAFPSPLQGRRRGRRHGACGRPEFGINCQRENRMPAKSRAAQCALSGSGDALDPRNSQRTREFYGVNNAAVRATIRCKQHHRPCNHNKKKQTTSTLWC